MIGIAVNANKEVENIVDKDGIDVQMYSFSLTSFIKAFRIFYVINLIEEKHMKKRLLDSNLFFDSTVIMVSINLI